jgi:copper chaperone
MSTVNTIREDLQIQGMTCRHCVDSVQGALARVDGVTVEEVGIGHARIIYPARAVTQDQIERALDEAGGYTLQGTQQVS